MDEDCMAKLEREATKVWAKMVELKTEGPNRTKYAAMSPKTLRGQANKDIECMSVMEDFEEANALEDQEMWLIDSGSTCHITTNDAMLR